MTRSPHVEILATQHDIVLGEGTKFVSRLGDAGTTLVTRGLAASGRPELALMLLRAPAAFPTGEAVASAVSAMSAFLREMAQMTMEGTPIIEGATMALAKGLVKPDLRGMVWVKPVPLVREPTVPPNALVGVPLFLDELKLARETSPYRVLARLGMEYREFPFAPWLDAMRESVSQNDAEQSSMLCQMARVRADVSFLTELAENNPHPTHLVRLRLRIHAPARGPIMQLFARTPELPGATALVGTPDHEADAWLAWRPDVPGFHAVQTPGSDFKKLTGTFFGIAPDERFEVDRALMAEDGHTLFPTMASWARLHAALANGTPLTLPLEHGRFELVWDAS